MRSRTFATALLALLPSACESCGSKEEALALAKSLSQERLTQLYQDMEELGLGSPDMKFLDGADQSAAFSDLRPMGIVLDGGRGRIHLAGCGDDKVTLLVQPRTVHGGKDIVLLPGGTMDPVVLWQSR